MQRCFFLLRVMHCEQTTDHLEGGKGLVLSPLPVGTFSLERSKRGITILWRFVVSGAAVNAHPCV